MLMNKLKPRLLRFFTLALSSLALALAPGCECQQTELLALEAQAEIDDSLLDFGSVPVGAEKVLVRELSNPGNAALAISSLQFSGSAAVYQAELSPNPVPARQSAQLAIRFRPLLAQEWRDSLQIISADPDLSIAPISVRGTGIDPLLNISPTSLDFGSVNLNAQVSRYVSIENPQDFAQTLNGYLVGDDSTHFDLQSDANIVVAAHSSRRIVVDYGPQFGGAHQAILQLDFCGPGCGAQIDLSGRCEVPRLNISPLLVDFGLVGPQESVQREVLLSNTGYGLVQVESAVVEAEASPFSVVNAESEPLVLAEGETHPLTLQFSPQLSGVQTGRLLVHSDDPSSPVGYVELRGQQSGAELRLIPEVLDFGLVDDNSLNQAQILLINQGDAPVLVTQIQIQQSGDAFFFPSPPPDPFWLAPNALLSLDVAFAPNSAGSHYAEFEVEADLDGGRRFVAALSGTLSQNRDCILLSSLERLNFGNVVVGSGSSQGLNLQNLGAGDCHINWVGFSPIHINDPAFSVSMPTQLTVGPGASTIAPVTFQPNRAGIAKAVVLVRSAETDMPDLLVGLSGSGAFSGITAAPPLLDFGTLAARCESKTLSVALSNVGQTAIEVSPAQLSPQSSSDFMISHGAIIGSIEPGASHLMQVSFSPVNTGIHSGLIMIEGDENTVGVVIPLSAQAVDPALVQGQEQFEVQATNQVDVLFVVDNSGSMYDNQQNLANNFAHFINSADILGNQADFHIGVITTDVENPLESGLLQGLPKILLPTTPNLEQEFAMHVQVGTAGSGWEQGLQASYLALSPPLSSYSMYNADFLRRDAALAIVIVSDEDDNTSNPVEFFVNYLQGLKAVQGLPVIISGVTGGPNGCQADGNSAFPAPRYDQAITLTGGLWLDICASDWAAGLEHLGETVFSVANRFHLSGLPDPETIDVTVNGAPVSDQAWVYDPNTNSLVILPDAYPVDAGDDVVITFNYRC